MKPLKIHRAVVTRLKPSKEQKDVFIQNVGCRRFVYNQVLERCKEMYNDRGRILTKNSMITYVPVLKQNRPWLSSNINSSTLQQAARDVHDAYQRFFAGQNDLPKFKSKKKSRKSFTIIEADSWSGSQYGTLQCYNNRIKLGKIGWVKAYGGNKRLMYAFQHKVLRATIYLDSDNNWYVSLLVEFDNQEILPKTNKVIGIDLGIRSSVTMCYTNTGLTQDEFYNFQGPKPLQKLLNRLKNLQRIESRRVLGSKNRDKARKRANKLHFRIKHQRKNFQHQLSRQIVQNFDTIVMEDLKIKELQKICHWLARLMSDEAWFQFRTFVSYKAEQYGKTLLLVNQYFPSSKLCSHCGTKNVKLKAEKIWECPQCNSRLDRDNNASRNLQLCGYFYNQYSYLPAENQLTWLIQQQLSN